MLQRADDDDDHDGYRMCSCAYRSEGKEKRKLN